MQRLDSEMAVGECSLMIRVLHTRVSDAQPCAQLDGPARASYRATVGATRRLADWVSPRLVGLDVA